MNVIEYPDKTIWSDITKRPQIDLTKLNETVKNVLSDIKTRGDNAVKDYELKFDHAVINSLRVSENEIDEALMHTDNKLLDAIKLAHNNIAKFHKAQSFKGIEVETQPGVTCMQRSVPIENVGLYIPGGTAPLFSTVLMLATPARIAGCKRIVMCTPPDKDGNINRAVLAAASVAGVHEIYKIGGVQAIGAMAYGTESIEKVDKIFGPGNQFVMAAKQEVSLHDVAIDMPAGPSEVCVIADETARPDFIAADMLSQAEHGTDSQAMLITTSKKILDEVKNEVLVQIESLPRKDFAAKSLLSSKLILVRNTDEAISLSNVYAPEHLIIATKDYEELSHKVTNAGSVFLGNYACESAGDYASGTNHTLPTHGYAKAYSGVNVDSFCRKITFQQITPEGIMNIGQAVEVMAENESLEAHKRAMTIRIEYIENNK